MYAKGLSRQTAVFVTTKHVFCRDKSMLVALSRPNCVYRGKTFVATNTCFVSTSIPLSRQKTFCRDKHMFIATKVCLSRQK